MLWAIFQILHQGSTNIFLKGQVVNILSFVNHVPLSKPLNFTTVAQKQPTQYVNQWLWLCANKMLFMDTRI